MNTIQSKRNPNAPTFPCAGKPVDGAYNGDYHSPCFWIKDGIIYTAEIKLTPEQIQKEVWIIGGTLTDSPSFPNYSEWTDEQRAAKKAERLKEEAAEAEEERIDRDNALKAWNQLTDEQRDALDRFIDRDLFR